MHDKLGDYMKSLEGSESARRAIKGLPLIARLDGRAFHTFTRLMKRPFDPNLTILMQATTQHLVEETNALVGYTQSDEITLIWFLPESSPSQYLFDGRYQKLCSILAATATGFFVEKLPTFGLPVPDTGKRPTFDARMWQVPTLHDAFLTLLWRERDAIKNSITLVAQANFSHQELHKVNGEEKCRMLREVGDPWEAYYAIYRKGSYFNRQVTTEVLSDEILKKIPEKYRPENNSVQRNAIVQVDLPDMEELVKLPETERNSIIFGV